MIEFLNEEFTQIGCKDPKLIAVATQVYLELCEVKRYWDVKYFYNNDLESIYFTAKPTKEEENSIFFPIEVSQPVSVKYLQNLLQLCQSPGQKLIIVIVHSDSTCVYYEIFNGLMVPVQDSKISHQEQSRKIDSNLRKHRAVIEEAALCGMSLTLPTTKLPTAPTKGEDT